VYAIGDIHGRADLLIATFAAIDSDRKTDEARGIDPRLVTEVYLGDYVDRGSHSRQVIDLLIERQRQRSIVCLAGNHESVFFDLLSGNGAYEEWLPFGGRETILSYGLSPTDLAAMSAADRLTAIQTAVPTEHRSFLASLVLSWTTGEYVFVHAGVRPGVTIEDQSPRDLLWIRGQFLDSEVSLGAIVVHGHTPVAEPDFRRYRINIDTGAYLSGRLTCMKIDAEGPVLLPTSPRTAGLA
jgi:serine/threonine protein phosphatase 1